MQNILIESFFLMSYTESNNMIVTLPNKTIDGFTLYAEGSLKGNYFFKEVDYNKHQLIFDDNYIVILFYTYPHHRRVYIVSADKTGLLPKTNLPCVKGALTILYKARGKKIDLLKKSLFLFRKLPYKQFPILFYQKLAAIIETNTNVPRFIINELLQSFNLGAI